MGVRWMKPPIISPFILLLVVATPSAFAADQEAVSESKTEMVSKVETEPKVAEPKSYDEMGFEELQSLIAKLEDELKDQTSLGSGGALPHLRRAAGRRTPGGTGGDRCRTCRSPSRCTLAVQPAR